MTIDPKTLRNADGTYPDDIGNIIANSNPEKRRLLTAIGRMVVTNSRFDEAFAWLDEVLEERGTRLEGTAGLFYGLSGVGKSTILKVYTKTNGGPFRTVSGNFVRPVARVQTPSSPDRGSFYDAILYALEAPDLAMGKVDDRKLAAMTQISLQQVTLLIFDEFTHVVEDKTEKCTKKFMREIKAIVNENICEVVLAGTEVLPAVHEQYSQMQRRSGGDIMLTPFDWEDDSDREEWIDVLEQVEEGMLLKPVNPLGSQRVAQRLHRASDGLIDNLMKLIFRATSVAYDEGHDAIADRDFWAAFERMRRGKMKAVNPWPQPEQKTSKPRLLAPIDEGHEMSNLRSTGKTKQQKDF